METNQRVGNEVTNIACKNSHFSSLLSAGDVSQGGTSATQ